ncbi:MAG: 5-formyltetrahydrofolate cyclo-ligase [Burkholderiales bacterium]|nr:5-formyltetrahydrofolate cyclo-ligase [Burkholderiales bacterium]
MTNVDPTVESKRALRAQVLAARASLGTDRRAEASAAIRSHLLRMPSLFTAGTVAAYVGFDTEIDTGPFIAAVLAQGKRLVLPRVVDGESRTRRHLVLHPVGDIERDTRPGRWGIREPDPALCAAVDPLDVDFVLLPGVAFDRRGGRLGYGAGFYDRLLGSMRPDCLRVAAAFSLQVVPQVPLEGHDQRVQRLVTEDGEIPLADPQGRIDTD